MAKEENKEKSKTLTSAQLEDKISEVEGITVIIRASKNDDSGVSFNYQRCSPDCTIKDWADKRLAGLKFEFEVVDSNKNTVKKSTKLSTVKK